jgi:hypothetical protein
MFLQQKILPGLSICGKVPYETGGVFLSNRSLNLVTLEESPSKCFASPAKTFQPLTSGCEDRDKG